MGCWHLLLHGVRFGAGARLITCAAALLGGVAVTALLGETAHGHHDPRAEAEALTTEMAGREPTVEALLKRANLWRSVREYDFAIRDLEEAATLNPESVAIHHALAEVHLARGELKPAFAAVEKGLAAAGAGPEKAALLMMRASIWLLWKAPDRAATDCQTAFEALPNHGRIDWYLRRAHAQRLAGLFETCEEGLREGFASTRSAVLYAQWVDALIDAGRHEDALREVEMQLPRLRYAASWKIRKARSLQGLGRDEEAGEELKAALEELNDRIRPDDEHPDITLLADRGLAHFLLGDRKAARRDYERTREAGAVGWMHWRLSEIFASK